MRVAVKERVGSREVVASTVVAKVDFPVFVLIVARFEPGRESGGCW